MKGIVLAGGLGKRLSPLTAITNKHLLPVYDRPMIYHPIEAMAKAGIHDILLVVGPDSAGDFMRLLGNGSQFGLKRLDYAYQEKELGIAHAISLAEPWVGGDKMCVFLGDNILEKGIAREVAQYRKQKRGARVLLKEVPNARDYGVAEMSGLHIKRIAEKPRVPRSSYAVVGVYFYDSHVFRMIRSLKPSRRGELEVTDVNNAYIKKKQLSYGILDGYWADCGASIDAYLAAQNLMARSHLLNKARRRRR
jgi:glucose-1-phosphate thymidylyltransferase